MYPKNTPQTPIQAPDSAQVALITQDGHIRNRLHSIEAAVVVPALQGVITSLMVAPVAGLAAGRLGDIAPVQLAALVGSAAGAIVWVARLISWHHTTQALDYYTLQAAPTPAPIQNIGTIRVEVDDRSDRSTKILHIALPPSRLAAVATEVLGGRAFSEPALTGPGRPLSVAQFRELRDELLARRLAAWRNDDRHQGVELLAAGRAVFRQLAALPYQGDAVITGWGDERTHDERTPGGEL